MYPPHLDVLNSATKFPEIKTYHVMDGKGKLLKELTVELAPDELFHASEKVDGTNVRIIVEINSNYDWFIGSREELLYAKGDRLYSKQMGTVPVMIPIAEAVAKKLYESDDVAPGVYTIFGELYGGKMPAKKQYTETGAFDFRVFDVQYINPSEYVALLDSDKEQAAKWRNAGGQTFLLIEDREKLCKLLGLKQTPFLGYLWGNCIPKEINDVYDFLQEYKVTLAGIDSVGKAEGIVIRNNDRTIILKLRFEDYEKTLGLQNKHK